ncbi:MAG: DNA-directed RNA polymerase subunit alpha [Patescibacteria group bacterium]
MNLISSNKFPIKTTFKVLDDKSAQLTIYPLNPGFGHTLGNSIRRALISSIPGYAVTKIKINNYTHEYQAVEGIVEDIQQIVLNIKNLSIKVSTNEESVNVVLKKSKAGEVTASDFEKQAGVEVINKDLYICTIEKDFDLDIVVEVKKGYGFVQVDDETLSGSQLLTDLYVDALYSPVRNVQCEVEKVRVGDDTNLDKIIITFETNGTVDPRETVDYALKLIIDQYQKIDSAFQTAEEPVETTMTVSGADAEVSEEEVVEEAVVESVESLGLTKTTAANLIKHDFITTADLIKQRDAVMLLVKTLKSKSDKEILTSIIAVKKKGKK